MIRVRIHINERQIVDVHAIREPAFHGNHAHHEYRVFITDEILRKHEEIGAIKHKYSLGASRLSVRMLQLFYRTLEKRKQGSDLFHI